MIISRITYSYSDNNKIFKVIALTGIKIIILITSTIIIIIIIIMKVIICRASNLVSY